MTMQIKMIYTSGPNDLGSAYTYETVQEVRDTEDATYIGKEFARLCFALAVGANEGTTFASTVEHPDADDEADT